MRFAMLGSGSKGNGTLVSHGTTTVLIDCGFMLRETERRLARLDVVPESLTAIVVTHEHADHIGGVARLARKYNVPVWLTSGTYEAWDDSEVPHVHRFNPHEAFAIGDLQVQPYPVPHDAREPCQYLFSDGRWRVGVLSDAGSVTAHMREVLSGCDALMLECNYDAEMLATGPYTESLKQRIAGPLGHLSNAQAAALLVSLDTGRLRHLVLTHLSEKNNTPGHARAEIVAALHCDESWPAVADQELGLPWRELS